MSPWSIDTTIISRALLALAITSCTLMAVQLDLRTVNDHSRNLGLAALDPEPLPERSGDAREIERDKASAQQAIRPVSPEQPAQSKASGLCQTYKV